MQDFEQHPEDPNTPVPRLPPHNAETESAVLSAWLLHDRFGKAWTPEPDLFFNPTHRIIAESMAKMNASSRDEASLFAQLESDGNMVRAGGSGVVHRVIMGAPAYGDPWPHVNRLREHAALREVLKTLEVAIAEGYEHKNLGATIAKIQDAVRAGTQNIGTTALSPADLLRAVAAEMMQRRDPAKCRTGLPTMDAHMGGFQHEQVTIFGAATNWGKSSYAVLVSDLAFKDGKRPLLVSFEDPESLYGRRLAARRAEVSPNVLRNGKYGPSDAEWARVLTVAETAEKNPFFINAIGKTVERVATDIRCLCAAEKYDIVIVDYLQAIESSRRHQDKKNEVTYIARTLTNVIKSSGCAGLMFSQFRRPLKNGEKPTMHMLKESGDLENAAEVVMIGFIDDEDMHVIRTEKVKDGIKHKEYQIGWNMTTCGFTGELSVIDDPGPLQDFDVRYP